MSFNFVDKYNAVVGFIVSVLTAVFGTYWYVFISYVFLNAIDWITGTAKARKNKTSSSESGRQGAIRKLGNWLIIVLAFLVSKVLVEVLRATLGIDAGFLCAIGWLTTCMLWINEVRSILENLVEMGCNVPEFLIRGLEVAGKLVNDKGDEDE